MQHWVINRFKRLLFGAPKRTDEAPHERLSVTTGLAVFSADALSSVAYATEEILWVLAAGGAAAAALALPVGLAIVVLVFIVAASYNQTIHAYPGGGGSYIVSKENLGVLAGLVAGAALLIDYVLTVAVSAAAGIAAITSAIPRLHGHEVLLTLLAVWIIAMINLRGVRESGAVFSVPTYGFIVTTFLLIAVGIWRALQGDWHPPTHPLAGFGWGGNLRALIGSVGFFQVLRAFASGCTALSGIEAVSNGVQAFREPEVENAVKTMKLERTILYTMFAGITLLAFGFGIWPKAHETVMSQVAREVFGGGPFYYAVQAATALILLLAANTAYADFPRLVSIIARDGFLPRRLTNRGDQLVFNGGIYLLAGLASALIVAFRGSTHHLIPLYAVGVFLAFTMSQTGMVIHWIRETGLPWRRALSSGRLRWGSVGINALGALLSGIALVVIAVTKFASGAWIVLILLPAVVSYFLHVHGYYTRFRARVEGLMDEHMTIDDFRRVKVVLTIGGLSPVIDHSMCVARRLSSDISAVYVAVDAAEGERIRRKWDVQRHGGVRLTVLPSPYRSVVGPLRKYLDDMQRQNPDAVIHLLVPVIATNDPLDAYLHNGTADQIIREFRYSEGILITIIPFFVDLSPDPEHVLAAYRPVEED